MRESDQQISSSSKNDFGNKPIQVDSVRRVMKDVKPQEEGSLIVLYPCIFFDIYGQHYASVWTYNVNEENKRNEDFELIKEYIKSPYRCQV